MSDLWVLIWATKNYHQSKTIDWKVAIFAMFPMWIWAFWWANFSVHLPEQYLKYIITIAVFIGIYLILHPIKPKEQKKKKVNYLLGFIVLALVGFWSGALWMAGWTFWTLAFVYIFHKSFLEWRSTDIVAVYPETIISVIVLYLGSTANITHMI